MRSFALAILATALVVGPASRAGTLCAADDSSPEQTRAVTIAAAEFGACSGCAGPEAPDVTEECSVPARTTQLCAAEVTERVAEALIRDLAETAGAARLEAMSACLSEARMQLDSGPLTHSIDDDWQARRRIALVLAERLQAEVAAETALVDVADLSAEIDQWLAKDGLPDRAYEALDDPREDICPNPEDFPSGWSDLRESEKANCALLVIAAAQTDLTDTGGPLPGGQSTASESCQPGNPGCCLVKDGTSQGQYRFPRQGKDFRATMAEFCEFADQAGLLTATSDASDAKPLDAAELLAATDTPPPARLRATSRYLADSDARHNDWIRAQAIANAEKGKLDTRTQEDLDKLIAALDGYLNDPAAEAFLRDGFRDNGLLPIIDMALTTAKCHANPVGCESKEGKE